MKNLHIYNHTKYSIDKKIIHKIVSELKKILDFSLKNIDINFVDSSTILKVNVDYLNHNYSTDIITFNYDGDTKVLNGEIFISIDDALNNAKEYNCTLDNELLRLIIHGFLHLVGYDDINEEDYSIMKPKEDELVNLLYEKYKGIIL
ncbi:MAG TPA: rRNA maturation RNase YbeY [Ignavibacteriales bacterium]|nr:rRNA maturation RNase YbeY [Ignavibacteriales bacterium]HOL80627.1 rRNA maturation RNase YbeY [Ignavibacteriales bacterium]HOM64315.1 rRNA maturation RNase YbeY [Ignavibacteriales bacterium]HPD68025.1 rRNA maturation RNase YbeY [Ignavibacteriales bacterium]HPP33039.1 rRNA maturation RNase YbeY [Ignavibacteriales bacterium]